MHTWYANASQPFQDAGYPIFLAEIASTLNEVLLTWHLLGTLSETRRWNDSPSSTALRTRSTARTSARRCSPSIERETHRLAEENRPLVVQQLSQIYGDIFKVYSPGMNIDDTASIGWCRIPHFYSAFYVYQYATGISAAITLAKAVRDEGQTAVDRVLDLYRSGGNDYPLDLAENSRRRSDQTGRHRDQHADLRRDGH